MNSSAFIVKRESKGAKSGSPRSRNLGLGCMRQKPNCLFEDGTEPKMGMPGKQCTAKCKNTESSSSGTDDGCGDEHPFCVHEDNSEPTLGEAGNVCSKCSQNYCDDNDVCTTDSCDANAGCGHNPIDCDDGDVCLVVAGCDATEGGCIYDLRDCDDGLDCT